MAKSDVLAKLGRRYIEVRGIWIQSLTELERINLRGAWSKRYAALDEKDNEAKALHSDRSDAELLVSVIVDSEGGNRVFADNEIDELRGVDSLMFSELVDAAFEHCFNGDSKKAVATNEKKSDAPADSNSPVS